MQKQAPSVPRVLVMVLFALSCFGLLLFLWVSFGGPIPFKPNGYQFKVNVPEATQLGLEADVREAGVTVGKVGKKELAPGAGNATTATIEMDAKYAPVRSNAKVILRQKTLLGETYLEITPGTPGAPAVNGRGEDLNNSIGNLPSFVTSGDQLMTVLDEENVGLRKLIANTGVTF